MVVENISAAAPAVDDWEDSLKSYYEKSKRTPDDDSSDEVIARVAKVDKETLSA